MALTVDIPSGYVMRPVIKRLWVQTLAPYTGRISFQINLKRLYRVALCAIVSFQCPDGPRFQTWPVRKLPFTQLNIRRPLSQAREHSLTVGEGCVCHCTAGV